MGCRAWWRWLQWLTANGTSSATSATVTGLVPAASYDFRVQAANNRGFSPYSAILTRLMAVGTPDNVTSLLVVTTEPTKVNVSVLVFGFCMHVCA